jgi:hypothetical protein
MYLFIFTCMIKIKRARFFRQAHRYLGLLLGIQFILWTASGLYFSWTNLDDIHGDQFRDLDPDSVFHNNLYPLSSLDVPEGVKSIELRDINGEPYYWINDVKLFDAHNGIRKFGITENEALQIAQDNMKPGLVPGRVSLISETGTHHEYRGRALPAYEIRFDQSDDIVAYVSKADGKFQTVRHKSWRSFDFLWMMHTMDYRSRDNFNTFLLRAFSLLGLITVISGYILWVISSKPKY